MNHWLKASVRNEWMKNIQIVLMNTIQNIEDNTDNKTCNSERNAPLMFQAGQGIPSQKVSS